jgi:hypothetical protein
MFTRELTDKQNQLTENRSQTIVIDDKHLTPLALKP